MACIFKSLGSGDRKQCSLVCLSAMAIRIEGQTCHILSLNANADLLTVVPSLFSRFEAVTNLALKCDRGRRSVSIDDDTLVLISLRCRNLAYLKLRASHEFFEGEVGVSRVFSTKII